MRELTNDSMQTITNCNSFKVSVTPELIQGFADHLLEIAGDRLPVDWPRAIPVAENLLTWLQNDARRKR